MTTKQFEHLGRAVAIEAELEEKHGLIEDMMEQLVRELNACGVFNDAANKWVASHYGSTMAEWHNPREFMKSVRSLVQADAKKDGAK